MPICFLIQDNWDDEEEEEEKVTESKTGELKCHLTNLYSLECFFFFFFYLAHFCFLVAVTKPSEKKKLSDKIKEKESLQKKKQDELRQQVSDSRHAASFCSG